MSQQQTFVNNSTIPSDYLNQFDLDISDATIIAADIPASGGSDSPVGHIERIAGDNGIKTVEFPGVPGTFGIRFIRGEGLTTNLQTTALITQAVPTDTAMTIQVIIAGIADDGSGAGGYTVATVKNLAGTVSIIDEGDLILNSDGPLHTPTAATDSAFQITASGANFVVSATGVAGRVINWTACLPGIVVGG